MELAWAQLDSRWGRKIGNSLAAVLLAVLVIVIVAFLLVASMAACGVLVPVLLALSVVRFVPVWVAVLVAEPGGSLRCVKSGGGHVVVLAVDLSCSLSGNLNASCTCIHSGSRTGTRTGHVVLLEWYW